MLLGNGNGTFQAEQSFGVGSYSYGLTVADFNNDGKVDVAVSNYSGYHSLACCWATVTGRCRPQSIIRSATIPRTWSRWT